MIPLMPQGVEHAPRMHLSFPTFPDHTCLRVADLSPPDLALLRQEMTGIYQAIFVAIDAYCADHPDTRFLACLLGAQCVYLTLEKEG